MNANQFDVALASSLGDEITAPGQNGAVYTYARRLQATIRAIREYSRYRPKMRRYGTANVFGNFASGVNFIVMVGGTFNPNDKITLDPFTPSSEQVIVQSVVQYTPVDFTTSLATSNLIEVTFTTNTTFAHNDGAFATKPQPGLVTAANQDTYYLPLDWIEVDQNSFDLSFGVKLTEKADDGFYDASYYIARQLSGFGFGSSSNYGVGNPFGYAISGDPFNNPAGAPGGGLGGGVIALTILKSDSSQLIIQPTPTGDATFDFFYYGGHTVATTPLSDEEPILTYAEYSAISARLKSMNEASPDRKIGEVSYFTSRNVDQLRRNMEDAYKIYRERIREVPFITSG